MKRLMYLFALISVLITMSCSNEMKEEIPEAKSDELIYATFRMGFDMNYQPITRAYTNLSDVVSYLHLILRNTTDNLYTEVSQVSTDESFGSITVGMKNASYNIYAVGAAGSPSVDTNRILSFPDDIVEDTYFVLISPFNPATTPAQSLPLNRKVAMVKVSFTDSAIPAKVAKIRFIHSGYTKFNIINGGPASGSNGSHTVEIAASTTKKDYSFMCFSSISRETMAAKGEKINVTVEAVDSNNKVLWSKALENVPIQCNFITTYTGSVFTDNYNDFTMTVDNAWGTGWDYNNQLN